MPITYSHQIGPDEALEAWKLLRETYWSPNIRRDVVERAIQNSICIAATEVAEGTHAPRGRLVGFARLVTDRATFAWLCDVFVVEDRRGQGIATAMVRRLMAHPDVSTVRRFCLATQDAQRVYAPLGFEVVPAGRWMQRKPDPSRWSEPRAK